MNKNDGGPAFPSANDIEMQPGCYREGHAGMKLRDYLAAKALTMVSAGNTQEDLETWDYRHFAEYAYRMADAMLLERAK